MGQSGVRRLAARSGRRLERQSPLAWAVRGGLAVAALALGYGSTTRTLAFVLAKTNAQQAHALAPGDGRVAGELAEQIITRNPDGPLRNRGRGLAQQALADEALAAPALTALALDAQLSGRTADARRLFRHANAVSRRDFGTRLWLIEDAVNSGDIARALDYYDIALRTSKAAPEVLYPVLSEAIGDPRIADALTDRLVRWRPPWGQVFVVHLTGTGAGPDVDAAFLRRLTRRGYPVPEIAQVAVVDALVNTGRLDDAWSYYATFRKGIARTGSRDPQFRAPSAHPSVLDWKPSENEAGITALIQDGAGGGVFEFAAPASVGGTVLQQMQLLPPGRYRIAGVSSNIASDADAQPYWQLECGDGRNAGRVELPASSVNGGRFTGEVVVPANCPVQMLRLVVRPSSGVGGTSGRIDTVALTPVG